MRLRLVTATFTVCLALAACAQGAMQASKVGSCHARNLAPRVMKGFRVVRVIEDPGSHLHWLIEQNIERPDWPARAIQVPDELSRRDYMSCHSDEAEKQGSDQSSPVVHAGDALLIVEDSPAFRAYLEGVALNNGESGGSISARLRIGGKVVAAVVTAPGRAVLDDSRIESYR